MKAHWVERTGARLFVAELGQGTPVVLIHGGLASHQACLRFAAPLADRMRLVLPDLRGSGRSIWRAPIDWELLADDIAGIAEALGIEQAVVGETSFGAACALRVAMRIRGSSRGCSCSTRRTGGRSSGSRRRRRRR